MRTVLLRLIAAIIAFAVFSPLYAQHEHGSQETDRKVENGGISAPGWQGKVDPGAEKAGQTVKDASLSAEGNSLHVTTGPAIIYWNPTNMAKGAYTVSATFNEPKFMGLNDHPHPYGIVMGGNDMGTDKQSFLYCAAYGNGNFIVRGFGPDAFQLNKREPNDAVHKASGPGQPVTQEIAMQVKGDKVSCVINGTVVKTFDRSEVVGTGK